MSFNEFVKETNTPLFEKLIIADTNLLNYNMHTYADISQLLTTPAKDLPEHYRYLVQDVDRDYKEVTLLQFINMTFRYQYSGTVTKSYFSVYNNDPNKIAGFVAYSVSKRNPKEIIELKLFSTNQEYGKSVSFTKDVLKLFEDLLKEYDIISWSAYKKNPNIPAYNRTIKRLGGSFREDGDMLLYTIPKD